jgi:hypothetical protein
MGKYPNLWLRNGRYYLRTRVPTDLVKAFGKEHIAFSLKTSDYRTAISRLRAEQAKLEEKFGALRNDRKDGDRVHVALNGGLLERLSKRDLERVVVTWFNRLRIPTKADSDSDRSRTAVPIDCGHQSDDRGQALRRRWQGGHGAGLASSPARLAAALRMLSPVSVSL